MNAREQQFRDELFALLRKHNVEMEVRTHDVSAYGTVVDGVGFWADATYENGTCVQESIDLTLGPWEDGKGVVPGAESPTDNTQQVLDRVRELVARVNNQ